MSGARHSDVTDPPVSYNPRRMAWVVAVGLLFVVGVATLTAPGPSALDPGGFPCTDSDSDGLCDDEEDANTDADNDPSTNPGPDTDGDTVVNYLDADDDGDGTATSAENADPNLDGEPLDAVDSDRDGQPDYLDPPTQASLGTVVAEQKISDTTGGLTAALVNRDRFGHDVAAIGDIDGDGVTDLAVGAPEDDDGGADRGAVHILFLNSNGTVKAEQKISDTTGGLTATLNDDDQFGLGLGGLGDLDGDGIGDLAVGAYLDDDGGTDRGAVHILFLNSNGTVKAEQKISDTAGGLSATLDNIDEFGKAISNIGDLDDDGVNDIVVGGYLDDDGGADRGSVYVLFLNSNGTVKAEQKISDTTGGLAATLANGDYFGRAVGGLGDLDGDGIEDIVVGSIFDGDGGSSKGAVYILFLNTDGTVKAEQKISDTAGGLTAALTSGDLFGFSTAGVGDVDGDGILDAAVGAYGDGDGGSSRGAVYLLFLNTDGTVKAEQKISDLQGGFATTLDDFDNFGSAVTGLGDLDGDGAIGLAVGTPNDDDGGTDRGAVYILDLDVVIPPTPLVVNSTGDGSDATPGDDACTTGGLNSEGAPECTMRAAIEEANALASATSIEFSIPTSDPGHSASPLSFTATPASGYPTLTSPVTIDGTTQPGWTDDPIVQLDGTGAVGATAGLVLRTNDSSIVGLIVHSFPDEGLEIDGTGGFGDDNVVSNNWVGLNASGTAVGNTDDGILVTTGSDRNLIGGTGSNDGNRVSGHGGSGIVVRLTSFDNAVLGNEVFGNTGIGIDLDDDGVTANDFGDSDAGSNDLLNMPVITNATSSGGVVSVDYDLDIPAGDYRVEFFLNPSGADPTGYGEGEVFANAVALSSHPGGSASHSTIFSGPTGAVVTATVTRDDESRFGPTSELSQAVTASIGNGLVQAAPDSDTTFSDTAKIVDLSGNDTEPDTDTITVVDATDPANGSTATNGDGTVTYTPGPGYTGADSFDYWAIDAGAALTHYWGLAGGGDDAVGTADGTLTGATTVTGDFGDALDFDEVDDRVVVPDLAYGSDFTISFEFKLDDNTGSLFQYVYSHGTVSTNNSISIYINETSHADGDAIRTVAMDGDDSLDNLALDVDIASLIGDGLWHTYTLTGGSGGLRVYLDGVLAATDGTRGNGGIDPTGSLFLGGRQDLDVDRFYGGALDSVQIYDRTLSAAEVADLAAGTNRATVSMTVTTPAPVTHTVNSTGDGGDASAGDGTCDTGGTNSQAATECTLRAAIEDANAYPGTVTIEFNMPATEAGHSGGIWTISPATVLPSITTAVTFDGSTQPGFGSLPVVALDGTALSSTSEHGLDLEVGSDGSTVNALTIHSFPGAGIRPRGSDGHTITGNVLGLAADGSTAAGNRYGMYVAASSNTTIGGTSGAERNIISGNDSWGVAVYNDIPLGLDSLDVVITGNYIGTDSTGLLDRGNGRDGLFIVNGSSRAQVGGPTAGERNIVAGNSDSGIFLGTGSMVDSVVENNVIGLGVDETTQLPNDIGVEVQSATRTSIVDNVIGPHGGHGISLTSASDSTIQGNAIGTDGTGTAVWPIGGDGIAANSSFTAGNLIGGTGAGDGNIIANVAEDGISITASATHPQTVLGNSIFAYGDLAIDLGDDAITGNDAGDGDSGPNELLNKPVITDLSESGGTVTVTYDLDVPTLGSGYRVEFFGSSAVAPLADGEARTLLGNQFRGASGTGYTFAYSGAIGDVVTASVTEDLGGGNHGDTSEMALARRLSDGTFVVNSTGDQGDTDPGDGICHVGAKNSAGSPGCTIRAVIAEANSDPATDSVSFAMPITETGHAGGIWTVTPASVLPDIDEPLGLDATTQPGHVSDPIVQLDGSAATGATAGLVVETSDSVIRGFIVHSFDDEGLEISGFAKPADRNVLAGNWVGIDASGAAAGNADVGILVTSDAADNVIGGTAPGDGNVIGHSGNSGILIRNLDTDGNTVVGNFIGVREDGTTAIANGGHGVEIVDQAASTVIGGTATADRNIIANNGGDGVYVAADAGTGHAVLGNHIRANGGLGIDIALDGVTANDSPDVDGVRNHPVLTSVTESGGTLTADFDLDAPAGDYRIEFFTNPGGTDPSGSGEGELWQHGYQVASHPGGAASYSTTFSGSIGDAVTATATTDLGAGSYGSTSEFAAPESAVASNTGPTADAGGPYSIAEGADLPLDGSGSSDPDLDTLSYAWDLDNDGAYDDAVGETPTVTWGTLVGLGLDDDGAYPIAVEVDDGINPVATAGGTLNITNTAPTLTTTGAASSAAGATYTLTLGATDPGDDTITGWTINWGDGTVDTIVGNPATAGHVYANEGYHNPILATATDEDGTHHQNNLLVSSSLTDQALRYARTSGTFVDVIGDGTDGLSGPGPVVIGPDGAAYVASATGADVRRFDPVAGGYLSTFVTGGPVEPSALAFGPDGHLYVADAGGDSVLRYNGSTGALIDTFITAGAGGLDEPRGLVFGPGDDLFLSSTATDQVLRFDGTTGTPVEVFVTAGAGGLSGPRGLTFGPDGSLYVASSATAEVIRYDGVDGGSAGPFVTAGSGGLTAPERLAFGPDGDLHVTDLSGDAVRRYDGTSGTSAGDQVAAGAGGLDGPVGLAFVPQQIVTTTDATLSPTTAPDVTGSSIRRSDLTTAGGLSVLATSAAVAADGFVLAGGTERLIGPAADVSSGRLSLSAWVNRGSNGAEQRLVAKTTTAGSAIYELTVDGATDEAVARMVTGGITRVARGGTVATGAWHHVAATWDGTNLVLYVDGAAVDTVAAPGALATDPAVAVVVGNVGDADRGLVGTIDEVRILHRAPSAAEVATIERLERSPAAAVTFGGQQTGSAGPWTVDGTETRSGAFALRAPTTTAGASAWATATGIDEPGVEVDTWWWISTDVGVELATGVRTGAAATDQWETRLDSPGGWDLGRLSGATRVQDAAPAGSPVTGSWVRVTVRSDQNGDSSVLIGGTEIIAATNQGASPAGGSIGLRAGLLPPAESWYVDDVRGRRLVTPEPVATLGSVDRR